MVNDEPNRDIQIELMDADQKGRTEVAVPFSKKVYKIGYMKPYTTECITKQMLRDDISLAEDVEEVYFLETMKKKSKTMAKLASYIILNNFFLIKLMHPIYWRWLYYIKSYDYGQLLPLIEEGKKKIPLAQYLMGMMYGATMMVTMKQLTSKEAKQFHQELMSGQGVLLEKSSPGQ